MRLILLLAVLTVSACADKYELADCKGPLVSANPSHWQPTKEELAALAKAPDVSR